MRLGAGGGLCFGLAYQQGQVCWAAPLAGMLAGPAHAGPAKTPLARAWAWAVMATALAWRDPRVSVSRPREAEASPCVTGAGF